MSALIVAILGLAGELLKVGADAYANRNAQAADVLAKYEEALQKANAELDRLKADLAASDAAFKKSVADAKAAQTPKP